MAGHEEPEKQVRRVTARYDGHVQGVGFRYTAVHLAHEFDVSGYVQNESDGSVTVVAEGDEAELVAFIRRIKTSPLGRYITRESLSWSPATREFRGFEVRFGW